MFGSPAIDSLKISDASGAVAAAIVQVPAGRRIEKTAVIEQIKGADPSNAGMVRWHVQFLLAPTTKEQKSQWQQSLDIIVDPVSGEARAWVR